VTPPPPPELELELEAAPELAAAPELEAEPELEPEPEPELGFALELAVGAWLGADNVLVLSSEFESPWVDELWVEELWVAEFDALRVVAAFA
jgi:pilus assembly protein FimV